MGVKRGRWHGGTRRDWLTATAVNAALLAAALIDRLFPLHAGAYVGAWAAAIPWIVSGVSALASAYGAHKAGKAQQSAAKQQQSLIDLQKRQAGELTPYGRSFLDAGMRATNTVLPFYTRLATGDRTALLHTLAPQIRAITENYDRPVAQADVTEPRGAGLGPSSRMSMLSGRTDALNQALLSARLAGIAGLGQMGTSLTGAGAGMIGSAMGGLSGASNSNLGLLSSLFGMRNQDASESENVGAALANFIQAYQSWNSARPGATPAGTAAPPGYWAGSGATP